MDFDETFEAVLRAEFDMMKASFTKQVDGLNDRIENQSKEQGETVRKLQRENKELAVKLESMTQRVSYWRARAP